MTILKSFEKPLTPEEELKYLTKFIEENELRPVKLINTHCHLDHICGNKYVAETWKLKLEANKLDEYNLHVLSLEELFFIILMRMKIRF